MNVVRANDVADIAAAGIGAGIRPHWIEGPHHRDRIDVGIVTVSPGAVTPPHVHLGGQVIVVVDGRGFVETAGERVVVERGDVVVCPPGELHTHGALEDGSLVHITVSALGFELPAG